MDFSLGHARQALNLALASARGYWAMTFEFSGPLWFWKGPAPWYFITVPTEQSAELRAASGFVTYGWGMIPVQAQIGDTTWKTSLFLKDDHYIVPIRASVRKAEDIEEGAEVAVKLKVG